MHGKTSRKASVIKRLRYLWTMELFDSFFLPAVALFVAWRLQRPLDFFAISSAVLVAWLLWQGAAYWWLKLRSVKTDSAIAAMHLRWFRRLKNVNRLLIGLLPIVLIVKGLLSTFFASSLDLVVGVGFYLLAVLEQINYYHVQLMYDGRADWRYLLTHKRLKRSKLSQDLARLDSRR